MILYEGPSLLTSAPIVAIVTGLDRPSKNPKTGDMAQVWILSRDVPPHEAQRTGRDSAICGDCPLRPAARGGCYVKTFQAPLAVYKAYQRGRYPRIPRSRLHLVAPGRHVRIGAYGDPAAVPTRVWKDFLKPTASHTGYTHQWRTVPSLRPYVMASVENPQDREEARALGWRTFRIRQAHEPLLSYEFTCPASTEANHRTTCQNCGLCGGQGPRVTPAIVAHGAQAVRITGD